MWNKVVRRVSDPPDSLAWTMSKLPRRSWESQSWGSPEYVALGPSGIYCLHSVERLPRQPSDYTRQVHTDLRAVSDAVLHVCGQRVWPTAVAAVAPGRSDDVRQAFGVHYVPADHLLQWLLMRPRRPHALLRPGLLGKLRRPVAAID